MKRYDIDAWDSCMCESGEGSYVRYEDHAARLRELEADRYRLAAIVGRCRGLLFTSWREGHMGHRVMSLDLRISPERHGSLMHMLAAEAAEGDQVMTPEETLKADTSVAAARDKYVREGIERVMEASRSLEGVPDDIVRRTCDDALAEFKKEQQR